MKLKNIEDIKDYIMDALAVFDDETTDWKPYIETLEDKMIISSGDYIITGIKGERYPCKPDIFEKTYEKVED
jgi:hypothetical protein